MPEKIRYCYFLELSKSKYISLSNPSKDTHQQVIKIAVMITNVNSFNPHSSSKNLVPLSQLTDGKPVVREVE